MTTQTEPRTQADILSLASRVYANELREGVTATPGQNYLSSRWVFGPTVDAFRLGWAPPQRGDRPWIVNKMMGLGVSIRQMRDVGLVVETERGLRDPMEGRVVFPQTTPSGMVVGFVGRLPRSHVEYKDKYVATPATSLFRRSEVVYRIDLAIPAIKYSREAMVVEGLLDAVLMWQVGAKNVVATGTAGLTDAQAQIMARYAPRLAVMFDADQAGVDGFDKLRRRFGSFFDMVRQVPLPHGAGDPASWAEQQITRRLGG